ncbi:hypothetical protein M973_00120 [Francisella orientalis LADL 07-285A]|nr:hypothetical protein M973_00120 [Francisella orientalis LADL 07-285A]
MYVISRDGALLQLLGLMHQAQILLGNRLGQKDVKTQDHLQNLQQKKQSL